MSINEGILMWIKVKIISIITILFYKLRDNAFMGDFLI